jgi:hypothetical protein
LEQIQRVGKAQMAYYKVFPFTPNQGDFDTWIEGLPVGGFKQAMYEKGFEACKSALPFQRFYFEYRHDHGMTAYLREQLDPEDFQHYLQVTQMDIE